MPKQENEQRKTLAHMTLSEASKLSQSELEVFTVAPVPPEIQVDEIHKQLSELTLSEVTPEYLEDMFVPPLVKPIVSEEEG